MRDKAVLCALLLAGAVWAGEEKAVQGEVRAGRPAKVRPKSVAVDRDSELLGLGFSLAPKTCVTFDSALDLSNARLVAISLVAVNQDLRNVRLTPYFGVDGIPYYAAPLVIKGTDLPFLDGGSVTVPVTGRYLRLSLCNDNAAIQPLTQLSVYVPSRSADSTQ